MPSLQFKGKTFVDNHHLAVPFRELRPVDGKGTGKPASLHDNLIIHGDNLAALKALLPTYHNKVKCIYIDPPYNTGNEGWAYNDNVNSPMMQDWLGKTVDRDDLTRHDKWCCMMLPRLKLLRELLCQDGAIFISIDDNEVHNLRCLMDEVFGEENFVATAIWQKNFSPRNTARQFSEDHDFVVIYAQDAQQWSPNLLERSEQATSRYKNLDDDPRGDWSSSDLTARNYYSLGTYEVTSPSGKTFRPSVGNYFRVSPGRFAELEQFDPREIDRETGFVGRSPRGDVYLIYEADRERIKDLALTLDYARSLPKPKGISRLGFAPTKYLDQEFLDHYRITFCQLPFQIYQAIDALADRGTQHGT